MKATEKSGGSRENPRDRTEGGGASDALDVKVAETKASEALQIARLALQMYGLTGDQQLTVLELAESLGKSGRVDRNKAFRPDDDFVTYKGVATYFDRNPDAVRKEIRRRGIPVRKRGGNAGISRADLSRMYPNATG